MELILNYIMSFIQGISVETWAIIAVVFVGLFLASKVISTILRPIVQIVSVAFMVFSMYRFALLMSWF